MISKLLVAMFFLLTLASTAVNGQMLTVTASNGSVAADVSNGSGLIDFFIPVGNKKNDLSFTHTSFLTVEVNGEFFTNNPDLATSAKPVFTFANLMNGTDKLLIDKSGSTNDTIRMTWAIADSFQIIQDVYPVPFPISDSGQIVYKISVKNLQNSSLNVQAQYLLDNEISSNSPGYVNDNDTLATRAGYAPYWETFPNAYYPGIPPFELAFENGLCSSAGFPGLIGVGFTNDSLAPEQMGLMMPATYSFVDWPTIVQYWTWGFDQSTIGTAYHDAATLIQWPASGVDPNSETEIARGSYGVQQCQTCEGNLFGMIFHPEHIKWTGSNYSPQPFPVEAVILDPNTSALGSARATQTTAGPIQIISPQPTANNGYTQTHSMNPGTIQACELGDIVWFDSIDNSLLDCTGDSIYDIQISVDGSGVGTPYFLSPCTCPVAVDCRHINSAHPTHPLASVVSRTGSYDGSLCNMRCTDVAAFDSGGIPGGINIKSIVGTSLANMKLTLAPSHIGADSMFYTVCVQDSMKNAFATVTITDTSGNVDSEHYAYCTIADMLAPLVKLGTKYDTAAGPIFYISDDRPWDQGLDTIIVTNLVNLRIDASYPPDLIVRDMSSAWISLVSIGNAKPQTICIQAIDLAGNKTDTCFSFGASDVAAATPEQMSLLVSPNPTSGDVTIWLDGAPAANVEIFDVLGREVGRFQVSGSYDWQTSGLPAGTYILRAMIGGPGENAQNITKRIIKE